MSLFIMLVILGFLFVIETAGLYGFRRDYLGSSNSGAVAAVHTMGFLVGYCLGLQIFTILNSDYICQKVLGRPSLLSHSNFMLTCAAYNLVTLIVVLLLRERDAPNLDHINRLPLFEVFKVFWTKFSIRKFVLVNTIVPTAILCVKTTSD